METRYRFDTLALGQGLLGIGPLPGRTGDLAGDLAQIRGFGPALVISMTAGAEMSAHGADGLPAALEAAGIEWAHFPVTDFGLPDAQTDAGWHHVSQRARAVLDAGGKVFVHCKAGLGRSGMVALRLMVETGEAPGPALARLRAARPGTVETEAQERWASGTGGTG